MSKYEIYQGKDTGEQKWRWRLIADNGEIVAQGGEPFLNKDGVVSSIKTLKLQATDADVVKDESADDTDKGYRFEYYQGKDDQWYWRFRSGNNKNMACGEGYSSESGVKDALKTICGLMGVTDTVWANPADNPAAGPGREDATPTKGIPGS